MRSSKNEMGISLGLVATMAICCGAKLLLVSVGVSGLALLTGQTALISVAVVVMIAVIGFLLWQRRSGTCAPTTCPPRVSEPSMQSQVAEPDLIDTPAEPEPIGAGRR